MTKKCIILSALGEKSFNENQRKRPNKIKGITFRRQRSSLSEEHFVDAVKDYEVVAVTRRVIKEISAKTLAKLTYLKALAIYSTGYEWVDTQYLKNKGIKVAYLPGRWPQRRQRVQYAVPQTSRSQSGVSARVLHNSRGRTNYGDAVGGTYQTSSVV
jgi:lactate dehydrogenase-like 2-hydroxyacid dehydrogenase